MGVCGFGGFPKEKRGMTEDVNGIMVMNKMGGRNLLHSLRTERERERKKEETRGA